ncbi:MAG TPA: hypothetical protein VF509_07775 [Sphingobium sp.]
MFGSSALLLLAASAPAHAAPLPSAPAGAAWESALILVGKDANGVVWFVRAGDMANKDNFRPVVWVTKDHSSDKSTKARITRSLQQFDCMAGTTDVRATIGFSPKGAILWDAESANPDPQPIATSSMADAVRKSVCPKMAPAMTSTPNGSR